MPVLPVAARTALALLLLGSASVTVLRLLQPDVGLAIRLVAFTPLAGLGYAAALPLAVALLALVPTARRWTAAALVVAVLGLGLHGWWFTPQLTGEAPAPAADARPLVVMGANLLLGRADAAQVVALVRAHDVELLAATEITGSMLEALEEAGLDQLLAHRVGRPGQEGSPNATMVFSSEPVQLLGRVATLSQTLRVRTHGVEVFAVHPAPPTLPGGWLADHAALRDAVAEHQPDVVVGDFNATDDHAPMLRLAGDGYRSAAQLQNAGWAPTWPRGGGFGRFGLLGPVARIDHVLVRPGWTATAYADHEVDGSDHHAVVATVVGP